MVYISDTPDTDEGKLPETAAADEWDITSPTIEQRCADASAALTSPEKKKKPRIRSMGNISVFSFHMRSSHLHVFLHAAACVHGWFDWYTLIALSCGPLLTFLVPHFF